MSYIGAANDDMVANVSIVFGDVSPGAPMMRFFPSGFGKL